MNHAALFHLCRKPWAYPVGDDHLRVIMKAARGDLAAVTCVYGDRYTWPADLDTAVPMERLGSDELHDYWGVTLPAPTHRLRYSFCARGQDGTCAWLTESGVLPQRPASGQFQYAYIHRGDRFRQPDWIREAIFYQIFPDRFCNGNRKNDPPGCMPWGAKPTPDSVAGGDLAGIRSKLGYLHELGINTIYTTPLCASPTSHKYDTTDYYRIDPAFGTNQELKRLVAAAHKLSIRFLMDAVFNHSGREFFAFADVLEHGQQSAYRDWFYNLHSFPVDPEAVNYETFATRTPNMPKLDTSHPEVAAYLLDVAEYWIREAGIDGWRLDVANELDHCFWRAFRQRVKAARPDAFILGEIWHDPTEWLAGDQHDSVMNYPWREATLAFLSGQIDALGYDRALTRLRFSQPHEVARGLVNLLGSHDTPRVRTYLGSREKAAQGAVLLLTAPGVPMIYYGDEIGMEGGPDPDCRRCYPWDDPAQQDSEMLALYRRLIAIRRAFPWLNDGRWETVIADPVSNLLLFRRTATPLVAPVRPAVEEELWVAINGLAAPLSVELPLPEGRYTDLLAGQLLSGGVRGRRLELPPRGAAVLAPEELADRLRR